LVPGLPDPPACTDPTTCDPVSWVQARWRYAGTGEDSGDWHGGVITWPVGTAYPGNGRSGVNARTVYSESGDPLYPYMGAWADGCTVRVVIGRALIIEWERGTDVWRETVVNAGETHTISLSGSENGAMIETNNDLEPFTVSLSNCTPRALSEPNNRPPVANAGASQSAVVGTTVTLNGSGTDADGDAFTCAWTQTGGPPVTLSSTTTAKPTFTAPATPATLTFSLVVRDGNVDSAASTTTVTVTDPNLARGKTATQSSTSGAAVAARAVDGNTNGVFASGSVTQTNLSTQPWWQVDLGSAAAVSTVTVWTRTDSNRMGSGSVFISSTDMAGRSMSSLQADNSVKKMAFSAFSSTTNSLTLNAGNATGRYVRVQLSSILATLNLAEVQVGGTTGAVNLSTNRPATQSSTDVGTATGPWTGTPTASSPPGR
jgi:hypothetical protein